MKQLNHLQKLQLMQLERRDQAAAILVKKCLEGGLIDLAIRTITSGLKRILAAPAKYPPIFITGRGVHPLRPAYHETSRNIGEEIQRLLGQEPSEPTPMRQPTQEEIELGYKWALSNQQQGFSVPFTDSARWSKLGGRR